MMRPTGGKKPNFWKQIMSDPIPDNDPNEGYEMMAKSTN